MHSIPQLRLLPITSSVFWWSGITHIRSVLRPDRVREKAGWEGGGEGGGEGEESEGREERVAQLSCTYLALALALALGPHDVHCGTPAGAT